MAEAFSALQSANATLSALKTVRTIYMGLRSVNQDVQELFMDIDSLSAAVESVTNCLADPALARANEQGLSQGLSLFHPLTSCFGNCNTTVEKLRRVMSGLNTNEEHSLRKVLKFAKLKNRGEDLQAIRQQLGTQLASLHTSFSALQLQRGLQSDERDQQAYADLQKNQMELKDNLDELISRRQDVEATIQSNPESMDDGSKVLNDADEIRKTSLGIQKRVLEELQRRVSVRKASESAKLSSTAELPAVAELATSTMMRPARKPLAPPVRKPLVPSGPTFELQGQSAGRASVVPLQRTTTEPIQTFDPPPPLLHSTTSPVPLPQLSSFPVSIGDDHSQSNVHISSEDFETAMTNAIGNAEARKRASHKPFGDEDFDAFATLLKQVGKQAWSERPRTYLVLRMIGENRLMNDFVLEGCKDIHFPYTESRLPNALTNSSSKQSFLDMQYLVLSPKSADLVQGGPHRHLGRSADTAFTVIRLLGKGGQGVVDHVRCKLSLKEFARKRLQRQRAFSKDKEGILAFENEIHNLKRLSHRHLVRFVGSYTDPKFIGIIMEPVADTDLRKYLTRPDFPKSDFPTLQSFFGCLTSALVYLHSNRCRHKDIKSHNILIKNNHVLITDFGIANDWTDLDHDTTSGNAVAFTNAYAAPEVARALPRSMSADIWSMGCVFLEMLTVLEGSSPEQQRKYFETEGNYSSAAWDNTFALKAWIDMLEGHSNNHPKPIKWIRQMLNEDSAARPSAEKVYMEILEEGNMYCASCCDEEAESGASDADSYRGSDTDEDEVFTSNSNTRGSAMSPITSPMLGQSPTWQPLGKDAAIDTSTSNPEADAGFARAIKASPVPTPDDFNATGTTVAEASMGVHDDQPGSGQFHRKAELPQAYARSPSLGGDLTTGSQNSDEPRKDSSTAFTTDRHRGSMQWATVRDPEGNEIRRTLKKTFASDLSQLEAQVSEISERREDWQDLLVQAIRPHDATTNRYTLLHLLAKFEDTTLACPVLKLYLGEEADVDARDFASNTPLHHAAYHGKVYLVLILLDAGAKCSHTNFKGRSALHLACTQKHTELAQRLIKSMKPEELNNKDSAGWTALHHACASGSSTIVKALLEAGANALIMDKASCPPFWRCDAAFSEDISHFYRTWRASLTVSASPAELQDINASSSWSTCDTHKEQNDTGVLKGQRAATSGREPGYCHCATCVVVGLVKQLPEIGSVVCGCSRHLQEMTANILYNVAAVQSCIDICACRTCTEARQECGKQSEAAQPQSVCHCSPCLDNNKTEKNMTYLVPDLAASDRYEGHEPYDNAIEGAIPKLCGCEECQAVRYSNAVRQLAEKNFKGGLSYRTEPRFAWTHYLELCLQLSGPFRKPPVVSSMIGDVLTILLDCGANINSTNDGFTMLHATVLAGNASLANLLIGRGADLDHEARDGETALMMALMKQDTRMLRLLLRSGAEINSKSSTRRGTYPTRKRSTVLSRAFELHAQLGWMVPMLLAHKPDVDMTDDRDRTPLQWAIHHSSLVGVRLLIEAKCSLEKSTHAKPKPLFMAIDENAPDLVRLLADSGAEVHATEQDTSALHRAASVGHLGPLQVLMGRPEVLQDLQRTYKLDGCTPLHYLARVSSEDVAPVGEAMITNGAKVDAEDVHGSTALHHAARAGSAVMVKLLIRAGAVPEAQNSAGKTPSDIANAEQHKEIVELLGGKFKKRLLNFDTTETFKIPERVRLPRADTFRMEGAGAKFDGMRKAFGRK